MRTIHVAGARNPLVLLDTKKAPSFLEETQMGTMRDSLMTNCMATRKDNSADGKIAIARNENPLPCKRYFDTLHDHELLDFCAEEN